MDSLGTEVGQKMRSAVKAKLVELGTGGSAGYIDDELPDYVMIMVANKRSKQQMTEDLKLFLSTNTEVFVNWLHQVLQKLQEVTLPAAQPAEVQKSKRKISETTDGSKKDKKDKKKKIKRSHKKDTEVSPAEAIAENTNSLLPPPPPTLTPTPPPPPTITDVFAHQFIKKANSSLMLEQSLNIKTKNEKAADEFDIPTISEIAENAVGTVNRRKELSELAELQKKINQAKRQLKALGSAEESEDEDFINIKDDGEEELTGADIDDINSNKYSEAQKNSPKTYTPTMISTKELSTTPPPPTKVTVANYQLSNAKRIPITFRENQPKSSHTTKRYDRSESPPPPSQSRKRSIMDRLGVRPTQATNVVSLSANRRIEQEIYVPVFRRKDDDRNSERETRQLRQERQDRSDRQEDRDRNKSKSISSSSSKVSKLSRDGTIRDLRDRVHKDKESKQSSLSTLPQSSKQRIGSRVIVPPPKPEFIEEPIEVPVNSIVKVQPRPIVPTNKQASKNLLLRAVAEAQRSTALVKPREEKPTKPPSKLFTKSYKNAHGNSNIVIEVAADKIRTDEDDDDVELMLDENDYVTAMISDVEDEEDDDEEEDEAPTSDVEDDGYVYNVLDINSENSDNIDDEVEEEEEEQDETMKESTEPDVKKRTQFIVTLDDTQSEKFEKLRSRKLAKSKRPSGGVSPNNGCVVKPPVDTIITKKKLIESNVEKKERTGSPLRLDMQTQKVNKLIIKNDTEDEEELRKEVERSKSSARRQKRNNVSPIKFDLKIDDSADSAKDERPKNNTHHRHHSNDDSDGHRKENKSDDPHKVVTKRTEVSRKYENLPSLSSTFSKSSDSVASKIIKSKERCKYYPTCGKGENCEFSHPSACKTFPNCKFGDKCLYYHPKCKFDLTCSRITCNFSHTIIATAAPPLSSHVVPVSTYKSITPTLLPSICKFYPNCANTLCSFFHPKPCHFGKNCTNKIECNFYHFDMPAKDKLKWVASQSSNNAATY